ncbi:hypothetical protein M5K25_019787 [Dendrobium thyrsiflorum]|uniref:Uncharacterized protein n=1 Tax=Dendrobium thyrsiflorum TaxID=117978 RepID=A0ABD0UG57_DENTH
MELELQTWWEKDRCDACDEAVSSSRVIMIPSLLNQRRKLTEPDRRIIVGSHGLFCPKVPYRLMVNACLRGHMVLKIRLPGFSTIRLSTCCFEVLSPVLLRYKKYKSGLRFKAKLGCTILLDNTSTMTTLFESIYEVKLVFQDGPRSSDPACILGSSHSTPSSTKINDTSQTYGRAHGTVKLHNLHDSH